MSPRLRLALFSACCSTLLCLRVTAQSDFEWDYPEGLGVRYLLHDRVTSSKFKAGAQPPELRALFLPKSKQDWVRIKGTELAWGMHVYEFRGDAVAAGGFGTFLRERDPRRTFREFKVDGKPLTTKGGNGARWEFVDTWRPLFEVLERPQPPGAFRYAVSPELGVRVLAEKSMAFSDTYPVDGDNCYARLLPDPSQWVRIDGLPGPVGWMLKIYVFPGLERERSSSDRRDLVPDFAAFVDKADPQLQHYEREFVVRDGEGKGGEHRTWQWIDRRRVEKAQTTPCFFAVATVWKVDGRELVLLGVAPANDSRARPKECDVLEKLSSSLEPWRGKAAAPGFAYYNVAASCRVDDREVGVVVYLPYGAEPRPDKELLAVARRMAESLQPGAEPARAGARKH